LVMLLEAQAGDLGGQLERGRRAGRGQRRGGPLRRRAACRVVVRHCAPALRSARACRCRDRGCGGCRARLASLAAAEPAAGRRHAGVERLRLGRPHAAAMVRRRLARDRVSSLQRHAGREERVRTRRWWGRGVCSVGPEIARARGCAGSGEGAGHQGRRSRREEGRTRQAVAGLRLAGLAGVQARLRRRENMQMYDR
ncbi:hypothetical protein BDV95DRAFT_572791, partial [Massariosphaeria phaeospora]